VQAWLLGRSPSVPRHRKLSTPMIYRLGARTWRAPCLGSPVIGQSRSTAVMLEVQIAGLADQFFKASADDLILRCIAAFDFFPHPPQVAFHPSQL